MIEVKYVTGVRTPEEELTRHRKILHHLMVERIEHQKGLMRMEMHVLEPASFRRDITRLDIMLSLFVQRAEGISDVEGQLTRGHTGNLRVILEEMEPKKIF